MDKIEIINFLIEKKNLNSYLEIGIDKAQNFLKINCRHKECVDPYDNQEGKEYKDTYANEPIIKKYIEDNILTYKMTSDEFFETLPEDKKYDIVLVDGLHTEEQAGRDIINSFKHLNSGGFVIVHDCLPDSYEVQTDERKTGVWNGSVWKAIPMLKYQGIQTFVVDCDYGVGVLMFNGNPDVLQYPAPSKMDYEQIFSNIYVRNIMMSVITPEMFGKLFG